MTQEHNLPPPPAIDPVLGHPEHHMHWTRLEIAWIQKYATDYALAALAQQAQEPVAWLYVDTVGERYLCFSRPTGGGAITNLYTTPPAPQVPAPVDERAAFEASMREKHGWEDRDFQGESFGYFDGHTATAWLAWQARAALQSPAPKTKVQP